MEAKERSTSDRSDPAGLQGVLANLEQNEDGVWFSGLRTEVHYPDGGNELCQQLEERSFWFRHRNDCVAAVVSRYFPAGRFFDIGGGNGFVALALQKLGYDVVLVEPGVQGASCAKARGVGTVICSGIEAAGFPANSLQAVGVFDVIEHLPDDLEFLRTLWGLMADDGRIIVTVPAYQSLWSADDRIACHFRRYSMRTLISRLSDSGFQVEYHSYFFWLLPLPIFLFRTLPSWFGVRRGAAVEKEHASSGRLARAVNRLLAGELALLKGRGRIPFGGSCLVVARKKAAPATAADR